VPVRVGDGRKRGRDVRHSAVGWERSGVAGLGKGHVTDFVRNFSIVDMRRRLSSTASLIRCHNNTESHAKGGYTYKNAPTLAQEAIPSSMYA